MTAAPHDVQIARDGELRRVTVRCDLDDSSLVAVLDAVEPHLLADPGRQWVIDLGCVRRVSVSGWAMLAHLAHVTRRGGRRLQLAGLQPVAAESLASSGLAGAFAAD
ncbi:STAS domain-containing protein [Longispora albida]|uniref:STAS domain-containing protein n=1 Tax=Longispora albida TaxID=203523 RepID=UPI000363E0C5|nr:STAS domain-containing protein [Longispora albida]